MDYLTGISGTFGKQDGFTVVKSLIIHTRHSKYGPFGSDSGTRFSFCMEGWVITGFHGGSGSLVDSIGLYMKPVSSVYS